MRRLVEERPEVVRVAGAGGEVAGYCMERAGARAVQLGPCIASHDVGMPLLAEAIARHRGQPLLIDIPRENESAVALATRSGLTVQRQFLRMCRGEPVREVRADIWASSGPEMG